MAHPRGTQGSKPVDPPTEPAGCGEGTIAIRISPAALAELKRATQKIQKQFEKMHVIFEPLKRDIQLYGDVPDRMTPWQQKHWRDLTLREIKQRLDTEDQRRLHAEAALRGARRRPVMVGARPRERARGRSRVTRAGPTEDDPEPPAASPFQAAWRSALYLTGTELEALVSHARIRIAWMGRWSA